MHKIKIVGWEAPELAYGGPMVNYMAGKMNHGEMFKDGGITKYKTGGEKCPKGYINIDGKCIDITSQKYKDMLDKGQVGTMVDGKFWGNKATLRPIIIYSTKDKDTNNFFNKIRNEDPDTYDALVKLQMKHHNPRITLKDKPGLFDLRDRDNPEKMRNRYNPDAQRIYLQNTNISKLKENYLAELAHQKQVENKGPLDFNLRGLSGYGNTLVNMIKNFEAPLDAYDREYKTPGSLEYEAHEEIQPKIKDEYNDIYWNNLKEYNYYNNPGTFSNNKPTQTYNNGGQTDMICYDRNGKVRPCGPEDKLNNWLGSPMGKAQKAAEASGEKWFNPQTKKWESEQMDNFRHPMAGRYTAEAIANKFPNWMQYTSVPKTAGFIGANILGIGHELINPNTNPSYNLWDKIREGGEDAFNNMVGAGVGSLPFVSDDTKTKWLQYLSDNNMLPDGVGKVDAKKNNGKPNLYKHVQGGITKYGPGGSIMDGCPPYFTKNQYGICVNAYGKTIEQANLFSQLLGTNKKTTTPSEYIRPNNVTDVIGRTPTQIIQDDERVKQIVNQNAAEAKKTYISPAPFQTIDDKRKTKEKKKQLVQNNPNIKLDENDDIVLVNPDRGWEGQPLTPNAKRWDKGMDHFMNAIETTSALTGAGQIGSNLLRLSASALETQAGRNLVSNALKKFTSKINPTLNAIDEAGAYVQMDPIGIIGNKLNSSIYNPTTALNTANNTVTGVKNNLTNSAIEATDLIVGENNLKNITLPKITPEQWKDMSGYLGRRQFVKGLQKEGLVGKEFNLGDVNYAARSTGKTDALTKLALDRRYTGFRNVRGELPGGGVGQQEYTNYTFDMNRPGFGQTISEVDNMINAGVDFTNPQSIAEYQATHIPLEDYGYRSTGEHSVPEYGFLFRNPRPVSGKEYGNFQFKSAPNLNFESGNYKDWFKKYYEDLKYHRGNPNFSGGPSRKDNLQDLMFWTKTNEPSVSGATLVGPRGTKAFEIDKSFPFTNMDKLNSEQSQNLKNYIQEYNKQYNTGWRGQYKQGGVASNQGYYNVGMGVPRFDDGGSTQCPTGMYWDTLLKKCVARPAPFITSDLNEYDRRTQLASDSTNAAINSRFSIENNNANSAIGKTVTTFNVPPPLDITDKSYKDKPKVAKKVTKYKNEPPKRYTTDEYKRKLVKQGNTPQASNEFVDSSASVISGDQIINPVAITTYPVNSVHYDEKGNIIGDPAIAEYIPEFQEAKQEVKYVEPPSPPSKYTITYSSPDGKQHIFPYIQDYDTWKQMKDRFAGSRAFVSSQEKGDKSEASFLLSGLTEEAFNRLLNEEYVEGNTKPIDNLFNSQPSSSEASLKYQEANNKKYGGDISIPQLPRQNSPLLQFYYNKLGGQAPRNLMDSMVKPQKKRKLD